MQLICSSLASFIISLKGWTIRSCISVINKFTNFPEMQLNT